MDFRTERSLSLGKISGLFKLIAMFKTNHLPLVFSGVNDDRVSQEGEEPFKERKLLFEGLFSLS